MTPSPRSTISSSRCSSICLHHDPLPKSTWELLSQGFLAQEYLGASPTPSDHQVLVEEHLLLPQESIALNHLEASPPCSNHHVSTWKLVPLGARGASPASSTRINRPEPPRSFSSVQQPSCQHLEAGTIKCSWSITCFFHKNQSPWTT
jgi:hypothetical protein